MRRSSTCVTPQSDEGAGENEPEAHTALLPGTYDLIALDHVDIGPDGWDMCCSLAKHQHGTQLVKGSFRRTRTT